MDDIALLQGRYLWLLFNVNEEAFFVIECSIQLEVSFNNNILSISVRC